VYLSALPFAPEQSRVARKFRAKFPSTLVITEGKPSQWPMVIFTAEHHKDPVYHVVLSLDESTFASISGLSGQSETMYVCDSETGHCISGPFDLLDHGSRHACFSPDGKHILLKFYSYAVVLNIETGRERFRIQGFDFVFVHHDGRIASSHWLDDDRNSRRRTRILVKLWDVSNGALISNRLLEVNDVAVAQFSPNGRILAVGRKSEDVIESWNLEDGKDPQRFPYPPGSLSSLHFSPTGDSLMAVFEKPPHIYLRLDTGEMTFFSHDFDHALHIIHSSLTNYLFVERGNTMEIWDISATGPKMIRETMYQATSKVCSTCPSCDGRKFLAGYRDGSVRMWNLDLEYLTVNPALTTEDNTDMPRVMNISHSGRMVVTKTRQSQNIEFLDTTTGEVIARTEFDDYKDDVEIAFSPDEHQAAFLSESSITICDIMHPDNRVSFDPWPKKDVSIGKVAFQTCNDLVICASHHSSGLVQVWHRQDHISFECTYSLDIDIEEYSYISLAPDGLTVIIMSILGFAACYSWNYETTQFVPVHFDDQEHIHDEPSPEYSSDGKFLACWSLYDFHVRVWDTRTGQLVSKFPVSEVDDIALSSALIDHSLGDRVIALRFRYGNTIGLFDAYSGHLYAQILGQASANMAFVQDGKALAYYSPNFGLRIWDIAAEYRHSTHGYKYVLQGMTNGWVMGQDDEPLIWIPVDYREHLYVPPFKVVIKAPQISTTLDFSNSRLGRNWTECINKEWLRELEQKEKEVGNLLE